MTEAMVWLDDDGRFIVGAPVRRCHGCGYAVAVFAVGHRWKCPRRDCSITNITREAARG